MLGNKSQVEQISTKWKIYIPCDFFTRQSEFQRSKVFDLYFSLVILIIMQLVNELSDPGAHHGDYMWVQLPVQLPKLIALWSQMMIKQKAGEANTESRHKFKWEMFHIGSYFLSVFLQLLVLFLKFRKIYITEPCWRKFVMSGRLWVCIA